MKVVPVQCIGDGIYRTPSVIPKYNRSISPSPAIIKVFKRAYLCCWKLETTIEGRFFETFGEARDYLNRHYAAASP